jgi:hypothetical protein
LPGRRSILSADALTKAAGMLPAGLMWTKRVNLVLSSPDHMRKACAVSRRRHTQRDDVVVSCAMGAEAYQQERRRSGRR